MQKATVLNDLLSNLLNEVQDLVAALVVDLEGLIIAQQSVPGFNEEIIGAIMTILEQTLSKIKRYTETSFGSGTFDTNEFRLFYLELGSITPGLFVLVADPYANIEEFVSYSYIVAEKVSLILNNQETSTNLPTFKSGEILIPNHIKDPSNGKVVLNKYLLIGPERVGKSSLLNMYTKGDFIEKYKPTIGVSYVEKQLQITNRINVCLFVFEMGGLRSFMKIRRFFYKNSRAVIILFDYSREETLEQINEFIEEAHYFLKNQDVSYIIVGNKIDLIEDRETIRNKAMEIAKKYNCTFFETSAYTGEGLDEFFTHLASNYI